MSPTKTPPSPRLPCTGHQRESEGRVEDHVAAESGKRNASDGKDLEQHSIRGEGPAQVEGPPCCPTLHPA